MALVVSCFLKIISKLNVYLSYGICGLALLSMLGIQVQRLGKSGLIKVVTFSGAGIFPVEIRGSRFLEAGIGATGG